MTHLFTLLTTARDSIVHSITRGQGLRRKWLQGLNHNSTVQHNLARTTGLVYMYWHNSLVIKSVCQVQIPQ